MSEPTEQAEQFDEVVEAFAALERVRALHTRVERYRCRCTTTKAVKHSNDTTFAPATVTGLMCTEVYGPDEPHRANDHGDLVHHDGNHCWRAHEFADDEVVARAVEDISYCSACGQSVGTGPSWPCPTIVALEIPEVPEEGHQGDQKDCVVCAAQGQGATFHSYKPPTPEPKV